MESSPCWNCTREWKCATCHIDCPDYTVWEKKHIEIREAERKVRRARNGVYEQRLESVTKQLKRRRKM